jgi:hypothetical protein
MMPANSAAGPHPAVVTGSDNCDELGLGEPARSTRDEGRVSTELAGRWPAHVSREQITDAPDPADPLPPPHDEALDFVRFCYRRRRAAWPELYDEMCAVASRGAFRGLGYAELVDHGISFCLGDLSKLATLTERVVREEQALLEGRAAAAVPMMLAPQPIAG